MGDHGDTDTAVALLAGTFDVEEVDTWDELESKNKLKAFLCNMKVPLDAHDQPIPDMQWTYKAQEFRHTFSKKKRDNRLWPVWHHNAFLPHLLRG